MTESNTHPNGLPLNIVPGLVPGSTSSSAQAQAAAASRNGIAQMNALKAALAGGYKKHSKLLSGGLALQALPNSFPSNSPVNSGLQSLNAQTFKLANQSTANSEGDKGGEPVVIKTGGRRRTPKKGGKGWSAKYKKSINCRRPKGFSQRQHCKYGRKKQSVKRSRRT